MQGAVTVAGIVVIIAEDSSEDIMECRKNVQRTSLNLFEQLQTSLVDVADKLFA